MSITITYVEEEEELLQPERSVSQGVIDRIKIEIENALSPLAQGSEGYVRVESLEVNGTRIAARVLIRHKEPGVYKVKTYIDLDTDVLHPDPEDIKICIKIRWVGKVCITIERLFKIIAGILV